jgi:hypothetical protein
MGYHPETLAFSFPPYPSGGVALRDRPQPWSLGRALYGLRPWIGNRTDDSCGWFDRTPGDYTDAVAYLLKDQSFMHGVRLIIARREAMPYPFYEGISERHRVPETKNPASAKLTGPRLPAIGRKGAGV